MPALALQNTTGNRGIFLWRTAHQIILPEDFGMERCTKEDLVGGTPAENAAITRSILQGERGHKRNAVLLNAGAALYINDKAATLADAVELAAELIDSGKAMETLEKFAAISQKVQAVA